MCRSPPIHRRRVSLCHLQVGTRGFRCVTSLDSIRGFRCVTSRDSIRRFRCITSCIRALCQLPTNLPITADVVSCIACLYIHPSFFFAKLGLHAPPPPAIVPPEDPPHATTTLPPPPTRAPPSTPPPRTAATATKPRAAPHALPKWSGRPTTCHHHPPAAASPIAALHATAQSRVPAPPTTTTPPSKSNGSPKTVRDDGGSTVGLRFLGSGGSLWSGGQICITCQKRKNRRRECRFSFV